MIFATVGTQLPFPRFLRALDSIAQTKKLHIVAQTIINLPDLKAIEQIPFLSPPDYRSLAEKTEVMVGHAGIGTVLSAEKFGKPAVLFPRHAALGEHRNDHQLATAKALQSRSGIYIAYTIAELDSFLTARHLRPRTAGDSPAQENLIEALKKYISSS